MKLEARCKISPARGPVKYQNYAYITMGWQAVVTVYGLGVIHRISWWKNIMGVIMGTLTFAVFLVSIEEYVALII